MSSDHVERSRAVYSGSAAAYASAVGTTISPDFEAAVDRNVLRAFAELALELDGPALAGPAVDGPVIDAGCGTGRVARFLADHGASNVLGLDVAPGMIEIARTAHPDLRFEVAELTSLPVDDASVVAIAYWYSIITTPPDELSAVWAETDRVLMPQGVILVAFQCGGGESIERVGAHGTATDLTLFHHDVDHVCATIEARALTVHSVTRRIPVFAHEETDQAFIIATR